MIPQTDIDRYNEKERTQKQYFINGLLRVHFLRHPFCIVI